MSAFAPLIGVDRTSIRRVRGISIAEHLAGIDDLLTALAAYDAAVKLSPRRRSRCGAAVISSAETSKIDDSVKGWHGPACRRDA
jgi:hypothetical protein